MTTPIPTGPEPAGFGTDLPTTDGLPDAATVARWANEMFATLGGARPTAAPVAAPAAAAAGRAASAVDMEPSSPRAALGRRPPGTTLPGAAMSRGPYSEAANVPYATPAPHLPDVDAARFAPPYATDPVQALRAADLSHPDLPALPDAFAPSLVPPAAATPFVAGTPAVLPSFYFLSGSSAAAPPAAAPHGVAPAASATHRPFEVQSIRKDFPILGEVVHGKPLVWFDNAATTQKPNAVIERLAHFYRHENSNIHRAAHELAARATDAYEGARREVQRFLGAASPEEIVFVRGATEAINLVAQSWGRKHVQTGDEILISHLEHHANIVPWQMLTRERGATLKVVPVDSSGALDLEAMQKLLTERTRLVSIAHVSNALGTVTPVEEIVALGHRAGALVMIDGAQSVSHIPIDVQALDADFFVFSGHKVFGPTGIGVLYGKSKLLEDMPPWQGGGNMIEDVTFERTRYQPPPARFEAGTGNIADAVGLGAALSYLQSLGLHNVERYESELLAYATPRLEGVPGLSIIGKAPNKASVLSFVIDGFDPVAIGSALNQEGIAVRAGHHCAQPILRRFGHETTVRASIALYNTCQEVDAMVRALHRLVGSSGRRVR